MIRGANPCRWMPFATPDHQWNISLITCHYRMGKQIIMPFVLTLAFSTNLNRKDQ
ncbi:hypothetical protein O9992_05360 [Vibrio lentus]|nr:hypothetical protein [Vibrio lentus]